MISFSQFIIEQSNYILVDGRKVSIVKPKRARNDQIVWINTKAFDNIWKLNKDFYIGINGRGGIKNRYQRFNMFMRGGQDEILPGTVIDVQPTDSIELSEVSVNAKGLISFTNGRHRFAWMRDQGLKKIPVVMDKESIQNAKEFNLI